MRAAIAVPLVALACLAAVRLPILSAQAPAVSGPPPPLAFDAASIKPNTSGGPITLVAQPGGRLVGTNITLQFLIRTAYQLQDDQILGGPAWVGADRFDINARGDGNASTADLLAMTRSLLAERFKLNVHRDTRELPVYALVLARSDRVLGPQFSPTVCPQPDTGRPPCAKISTGVGRLTLRNMPVSQLLPFLSPAVNRVVVDRTGLTGNFDVDLEWTPMAAAGGSVNPDGISIFTAVQEQLGLKLDAARAPVDVIVLDRVEHPAEN